MLTDPVEMAKAIGTEASQPNLVERHWPVIKYAKAAGLGIASNGEDGFWGQVRVTVRGLNHGQSGHQ